MSTGSVGLVPYWLGEMASAPAARSGFVALYVRAGNLRLRRAAETEQDVVLSRRLENFVLLSASLQHKVSENDTVLAGFQKLQRQVDALANDTATPQSLYNDDQLGNRATGAFHPTSPTSDATLSPEEVDGRIAQAVAEGLNQQTPGNPSFTIVPTESFNGAFTPGVAFTGTSQEYFTRLLVRYQLPVYQSFTRQGQGSLVFEVGTVLAAGDVTFTWSVSNAGNVTTGSTSVRDETDSTTLGTAQAASGSLTVNLPSHTVTVGVSKRYSVSALNTQNQLLSAELVLLGQYYAFAGASADPVLSSAQARALPVKQYVAGPGTLLLETGTTYRNFELLLPPGRSLSQVTDLDNANSTITSAYQDKGNFSLTVNGQSVTYRRYAYQAAAPYGSSARHQLTFL